MHCCSALSSLKTASGTVDSGSPSDSTSVLLDRFGAGLFAAGLEADLDLSGDLDLSLSLRSSSLGQSSSARDLRSLALPLSPAPSVLRLVAPSPDPSLPES